MAAQSNLDPRFIITFRLAILAQNNSWYAKDLMRAATVRETIQVASYRDLCVEMHSGTCSRASLMVDGKRIDACELDAVLVRSMPLGSLEQVIFRVNALHAMTLAGCQVHNKPRTLEIAIDKWLTLNTVAATGIATPNTIVCQTREQALAAFEQLNRDVVIKPIFGGEGRGIMRVDCPDLAWRVFGTLEVNQSIFYLQEFIPHRDYDLRIFVMGDQAYAMKRINHDDWRTNVARGGSTQAHHPSSAEIDIAMKAAHALGGGMLGIDILPARDGRLLLLEVNAVPGWKALARTLGIDLSRRILDYLRQAPM